MMLDAPKRIRKGEELPIDKLNQYFQRHDLPQIISVTQFPSGFSNLTYCIHTQEDDIILRRAPFGAQAAGGHNMEREYRIFEGIYPYYQNIPKPIHCCANQDIIGSVFFLMERVRGVIIRKSNTAYPAAVYQKLSKESAVELARIHSIPKHVLPDLGKPSGYVERQISGWIRRHEKAKTIELEGMDELSQWLHQNQPQDQGNQIIHNDYKYDNLILHQDTFDIKAVLDWEMTTRGCPLMDLGVSLGYWLEKTDNPALQALPFCPTHLDGNFTRQEFMEAYAKERNITIPNPNYYVVYGVWRLIIILEQIYKRFVLGHTEDQRFALLGKALPILVEHAQRLKAKDLGET